MAPRSLFLLWYFWGALAVNPNSEEPLRLVGGAGRCVGNVEAELGGEWRRVETTSDLWDLEAAAAVCRDLGCGSAVYTEQRRRFDDGEVWFVSSACVKESSVRDCLRPHRRGDALLVVCSERASPTLTLTLVLVLVAVAVGLAVIAIATALIYWKRRTRTARARVGEGALNAERQHENLPMQPPQENIYDTLSPDTLDPIYSDLTQARAAPVRKETSSKKPTGYKCCIALAVLLLLGSIAGLIAVAFIQDKWSFTTYSMEYGIVIHSDSARSTIFLYEWPGEKQNETGIIREVKNCRVAGDGISEMKVDPQKDNNSWSAFTACFDNFTGAISAEKQKKIPLFLGATAGMRLLEKKNKTRADEIMESLRQFLSTLPYDFQNASILSGQEEGLYGWIAVNYLMENFFEKNVSNKYMRPQGRKTMGSLDLGGASTQIAFAVADNITGEDYVRVKLYGYTYNVYTHSFLCYGKHEAEKKVLDKIVQKSSSLDLILNPCYPKGLNLTLEARDIYDTQCTKMPENYTLDQQFFMVGTGESDKCKEFVKTIFDFDTCKADHCSFSGVEQPAVVGEYMAYSGFYFTSRAIGGKEDLDTFDAAVTTFCNTSWTELKKQKFWVADRFLKTYCTAGHHVLSLLSEGYKFDNHSWPNIQFERAIKETTIDWSLGYVLSLSTINPSDVKENYPMTNPLFTGLICLFSALIIITLVIVFVLCVRSCY